MARIIATFLLALLFAAPAGAQWQKMDGPYGGTVVSSIAMQPDGSVLAATAGGLFRSDDEGVSWALDSKGVDAAGIDARALLVLENGTVVAATFGGGIYLRPEGRRDWSTTGTWGTFSTALTEAPDGTLYAGTITGIMRSENGGRTWTSFAVDGRVVWVQAVAATDDYVFVAAREGIYRSADRGETWEFSAMGMTTLNTTALMAAADGTLFAGTSSILSGCRLYRSRSAGRLWTCAQPSPDPLRVGAIAEDDLGRIYVGGYRLIYTSDDGGSTWRQTQATQTTVHALAVRESTILAGTFGRGIVRSPDRAGSWAEANAGLASAVTDLVLSEDEHLYVATVGGVFRTMDEGATWTLIDEADQPVRSARALAIDGEGRVLSGTLSGLFRYDPIETEWELLGPPGQPAVSDLSIGSDGALYAGYYEGVYELRGTSWRSHLIIGPDQATRNVVAVGVDQAGALYAGGSYDSFRRTAETGSWELLRSPATPYFEAQVFAEANDGTLYAGTRYFGVMCSRDGGQSWTPLVAGLAGNEDIRAIAFDASETLFAGSFGSGVLRWDEQRRRWEAFNEGIEYARGVTGLVFDRAGVGYLGTYGAGVFRHQASSVASEGHGLPQGIQLVRGVHPHPVRNTARITLEVPASASVRVALFDLLGREVGARMDAVIPAGQSDVELSADGLVSGLYLARLTVQSGAQRWVHSEALVVSR